MALNLADRLLTIAVTATLTSAAWVVLGSSYIERPSAPRDQTPEPVSAAPATSAAPAVSLGAATAGPALAVPVRGVPRDQLVDTFRDARAGGARLHEALDIPAPAGTAVTAAAPGTIERLFASNAGGNALYLRSDDRTTIYYYAHLLAYAPDLREGQRVAQGEELGQVGATGNADPAAPHLHFAILRTTPEAEWWEPAIAIDPYPLLGGK